ncbi:GntR family transcriptional regulator [Desulfovibrio ferrophilus]|uniref:Transcriptional regulator, GntR family n=1 Tax=Desulfovibrio ferrophilus TaxID=241368 RepID=A0A2Z6B0Y0_9BACT|nr:GntR family transcriptional regulator [Desulfovibrio ferrophilus]BBD09115.1 transcriptional regulator, GntR family [Desulfovibrio ferrophilus]
MEGNNVITRRVLRDEVADYLIDAILSGEFRPGDKIVETRISKELQVSQGAVREAIRDLIAKGFLETEPYKGTRVREFSPEELGDYYAVRIELETMAVQWAIKKGGKLFDLSSLRECVDKMFECAKIGDTKNLRKYDIDFHKELVKAAGNEFLLKAWESLGNYYWALLGIHYGSSGIDPERQASLHTELIEALESRDQERVANTIHEHFSDIKKMFGQGS